VTSSNAWTRALVRRIPAWLGLVLVAAVLFTVTLQPMEPGVQDLSGEWEVWVEGDPTPRRLQLPGLFIQAGIPPESRLLALKRVTVGPESLALLIDRPKYAVTVLWDGVPLGASGDPASESLQERSGQGLFVALPPSAQGSTHTLGLDLRGAFGKGGITGRVLVGPVPQVHAVASATEVQRLAFGLGLALLAAMPLVVGARGAWRPAYVAYGLFASALSVQSLAQSNLVYEVLPHAGSVTRLLRAITPLVAVLGLTFIATFVRGQLSRPDRALVAVGLGLSLLGLLAPARALYALELAGEILFLSMALLYVWHTVFGLRERQRGSPLLAAAVLPILWTLASEITLTHGLRSGETDILVSGLLFMSLLGAALVVRDAEVSEQHARLIRGSLDAMVTVDHAGRVRDANPAAHQLLAPLSRVLDVRGADIAELVVSADRALVRAHLARAVTRPDRIEFRSQHRVLESLATPLGTDLTMLTLRDITVRRELDRGLLQAARMETVALLLGGIAHDFNNMLSTLLAHLGLLRGQVEQERARERIDRMEGTIDRASELTRRLLTVARGTGSELGALQLEAVVSGAVELVEPGWPADVQLKVDVPPGLPPVLGASGDLEQVIVNLLVNARDAVGERGHIRIAARTFRQGERSRGVALMVEDDGPGIPPDRKDEVFHPFFTTKPRGTGLGLAVARQILRDHHGRIWVEPSPGGGARFLLALRQAEPAPALPTPPAPRRILLVEDEQVLLEDYARALTEAGNEVAAFSSSTEAAVWLADHRPDLMVTDVVMPGMNGLDLARRCLDAYPDTPVLFVSAFVPPENTRWLPTGSWQALHKPVRASRLVSTVQQVRLRGERVSGDDDTTWVNFLFPDLTDLAGDQLPFDE
jgi:nitrogen-specific signal transduction histidine kinase/CheY-like chemotaxis protein